VYEPVDVVAVSVGDDNFRDLVEAETCGGHRGWKFLLVRDLRPRERHVPSRCRLTGVDESQRALVLDRPSVDRQRVREGARHEQIQLASWARTGKQEAVLDAHRSGGEGVDLHVLLSLGSVTGTPSGVQGSAKPGTIVIRRSTSHFHCG
jgi:hypothetical protein